MTRKECEDKILALATEARNAYLEYNPSGDKLSIIISGDIISFNDYLHDENGKYPSMIDNFDAAHSIYVHVSEGSVSRTEYWREVFGYKEASA